MIEELFPNLFLLLKTAGWVLGIGFTLCISIRLLDMLKKRKNHRHYRLFNSWHIDRISSCN